MAQLTNITIETPEHFELTFGLAGPGSRFTAYAIDKCLQLSVLVALLIGFLLLSFIGDQLASVDAWIKSLKKALAPWTVAIIILAYGMLSIGYFIVFEYFWSGFTPGKRTQRIRVIRNDGRPITLLDSVIRNVIRSIDILGEFYPVGLFVILIDPKKRRLGDIAAGTLVIADQSHEKLVLDLSAREPDLYNSELMTIVSGMTPEDFRVISEFLGRKNELDIAYRDKLAEDLLGSILHRTNQRPNLKKKTELVLLDLQNLYMRKTRVI